jgi:hypothetical protein
MGVVMAVREQRRRVHEDGTAELAWAYHADDGGVAELALTEFARLDVTADAVHGGRSFLLGALMVHRTGPDEPNDPSCPWRVGRCRVRLYPTGDARRVLAAWAAGGFSDEAMWVALGGVYRTHVGGV